MVAKRKGAKRGRKTTRVATAGETATPTLALTNAREALRGRLLDNTNIALMVATLREDLIDHPHIAPMVAELREELARSRPRASWGAMRLAVITAASARVMGWQALQ